MFNIKTLVLSLCLIKHCAVKIYIDFDTNLQNFFASTLCGSRILSVFSSSLQIVEIRHPKRVECPYDHKQYVLSISTVYLIRSCVFIHRCLMSLKLLQINSREKYDNLLGTNREL